MINPNTATNLDTTDPSNFFYGQLKDASTTTAKDGTRINKTLLADIRTVFMRAVKLTGIPISGNFDTENSSQLFDACFGTTKVPITTFYNGVTGGERGDIVDAEPIRVWKENGGKIVRIEGWVTGGTTVSGAGKNVFNLPSGYKPAKGVYILAMGDIINQATAPLLCEAGTGRVLTTINIAGSLGDINHYINASIPLD